MLGTTTITVTRQDGDWVAGRYVPEDGASFSVVAQVEDIDPKQAELLPEAARTKCRKVARVEGTTVDIRPTDVTNHVAGDRITYRSRTYVVLAVKDFRDHTSGLPHVEAYMAEVGDDE